MPDRSRLSIIDPTLHFICLRVSSAAPDQAGDLLANKMARHEAYTDPALFHSEHFKATPRCNIRDLPSIRLAGLDEDSFSRLADTAPIYRLLLDEQPRILQGDTLRITERTYSAPIHMRSIEFRLDLRGAFSADHLVALVNGLADRKGCVKRAAAGTSATLLGLLPRSGTLPHPVAGEDCSPLELYETFTVIAPERIDPDPFLDSGDVDECYLPCIAGLAIRRVEHFRDIEPAILARMQKNTAVYRKDLVYLNYHNLLCYTHYELSPARYIRLYERMRLLVLLLHHYDAATYELLTSMKDLPRYFMETRAFSRRMEKLRFESLQALDTYRILTSSTTTRVSVMVDRGIEVFRIPILEHGLNERLAAMDSLAERQHSRQLEIVLQWTGISIALLGILVALVVSFPDALPYFGDVLHKVFRQVGRMLWWPTHLAVAVRLIFGFPWV